MCDTFRHHVPLLTFPFATHNTQRRNYTCVALLTHPDLGSLSHLVRPGGTIKIIAFLSKVAVFQHLFEFRGLLSAVESGLVMANSSDAHIVPEALKTLWISNGLPEDFLSHLKLTGNPDTAVPSSFRLGLAAQVRLIPSSSV